jgi:phosphatidylglycerophosphate synthase
VTAAPSSTAPGGREPVVIYLATRDDLQVATLAVAGQPLLFRAVAGAVRAGAARVLVPARFQPLLGPALATAPRVWRAVEWLDGATPPAGAAVLVPATAVLGTGPLAAMMAASSPAVHRETRNAGVPIVAAPAPLVASLWSALVAGGPVGAALEKALTEPAVTVVCEHEPSLVHPVHDAASAVTGERRLYATLGSAIDTRLDTVFHRRVSRLVSRHAVAAGIGPNALTVVSLLVGLAAAWAFWRATPASALAGVVLYAIAVVIDHADGEVARLTLTDSAIGEWLDIAADTAIHVAVVLALGSTSAALTGAGLAFGSVAALGVIASAAVAKLWSRIAMPDRLGLAISGLGSRDGFYAMLLAFILTRTFWPAALPALMIVVAAGTHAYWVGRVLYRLMRGA